MIQNTQKNCAQQAMDFALRHGCQSCRIGLYASNNCSIDMRDMKMEQLSQAAESRMQIELFVDGRYGTFSTNRIEKNELESLIKNGIAAVRYLQPDECRQLPDQQRYFKGKQPDLQQFDAAIDQLSPESKKAIVEQNMAEIMGANDKIISVNGSYSDGFDSGYMIASNGFEGESKSTGFSVGIGVSLKGKDDARPEECWFESALFYNDLIKTGIGKIALDRGMRKLNQKKVPSGKYTMIVENLVAARLLAPILDALNGNALQQKNSFLLHQLNQKIAAENLTIKDEPHIPKSFGARMFDEEGIATVNQPIIENGVLKMYFIDTYSSLKMNVSPTISSPSQLVMTPGKRSLNEMIASTDKAILVTGFNGGNSNPTTGDFSFGIEGFFCENGKMKHPVSEMNITGNMIDLWHHLIEIGNDPRLASTRWIPTLIFDAVNFSGL
ncbi:MAG: TldD/PmbA family protein [Bacteroidales bacterium]|nr:TldD/PmbA family protein [Bacteroidales bacterium]